MEQLPPPPDPSPRRDASPRAGPGPRREAGTFLNPRASARREDGVAGVAVDDPGRRRVLFVSHTCYLDSNNGASVASRSMMESLSRNRFSAAAMYGTVLESARKHDPGEWLAEQGLFPESGFGRYGSSAAPGPGPETPLCYRLDARGVPVLLHRSRTTSPTRPRVASSSGCSKV